MSRKGRGPGQRDSILSPAVTVEHDTKIARPDSRSPSWGGPSADPVEKREPCGIGDTSGGLTSLPAIREDTKKESREWLRAKTRAKEGQGLFFLRAALAAHPFFLGALVSWR